MKATTPRVNSWIVRWYPNKDTRLCFARLFRPITVMNLMWRHSAQCKIRLRLIFLAQIITCSVQRCILLASCHYAILVLHASIAHACISYLSLHLIVFPWIMHSFKNVGNFKYNRQLGQNSVICLSSSGRKSISCWILKVYRSSISIGKLCNLYLCTLIC